MKNQSKTKKQARPKAKAKSRPALKSVKLVGARRPIVRSFRLVSHKHTGRLIHHRHTSHLALIIFLIVVGFFLYVSASVSMALSVTYNSAVTVGAVVNGPAPTIGAVITSPVDGASVLDKNTYEISGTCPAGTYIVVKNNNALAGTAVCTEAGIFVLQIQLVNGTNVITAQNYDNVNQAGPATLPVAITSTKTVVVEQPKPVVVVEVPVPTLPTNPSTIPSIIIEEPLPPTLTGCAAYEPGKLQSGGQPHIAAVCVPRLFNAGSNQELGFVIWGGTAPYAVSIDWGDDSTDSLISHSAIGYFIVQIPKYKYAGSYIVTFRMTDKSGLSAIFQTAVQVNGQSPTAFGSLTDDLFNKSWFQTPVPLYLLTVAITLGFWGGDLFDRKFGSGKSGKINRKLSR